MSQRSRLAWSRPALVASGALAGGLLGLVPALATWAGLPVSMEIVALVGTPGAYLVSWISGWPLEQEAALACYAIGFVITPPLVLAPFGSVAAALVPLERSRDQGS